MYERFTDRARKVMQLANQEAQRFNHEYIGTEHILLGLTKEGSGVAAQVLKNLDIDLRKVRVEVERIVNSGPDMVKMGILPQTPRARKVLEFAMEEAKQLNQNHVGTEHLLLGLLREQEGVAAQVLMNLGMRLEDGRSELLCLLDGGTMDGRPTGEVRGPIPTPVLDSLGRDLTALAARGQLEPVVGREADVERVLEGLSCRTWNRVLLVSESAPTILGVVETIACRIVNDRALGVPRPRLIAVHPCSFLGGKSSLARMRLLQVLAEARRASEVLLFLDDLHLLAQCEPEEGLAGVAQASLLIGYRRPLLAAATPEGYRQFLEPNGGLASLFDTFVLQPPTREQALESLQRLRHRFETHHCVRITDAALTAAVEAAMTMPATRPFADWATLLLDRACARLRMRGTSGPCPVTTEAIAELTRRKERAVAEQDFELAVRLRDQVEELKQTTAAGPNPGQPLLTPDVLHEVAQSLRRG